MVFNFSFEPKVFYSTDLTTNSHQFYLVLIDTLNCRHKSSCLIENQVYRLDKLKCDEEQLHI